MPKRLLNVGCNRTGDAPDRVFLFDAVSPAPYAHGSGIPISALPQTIQDAVTVCRGINIQNLWVDSLCIVQDDGDDWSQEAGRMFDVYLNSELTIYAKQSSNCNLGFLGPQTYGSSGWQRSVGTIVAPKFLDSTDELLLRTGELDYDTRRYPLDTRGWSLQELIAPNRRLIFTGREMIWSCNGYRVSETMTESDLPYRGAYELHQFKSKLCVDQVDESEKEFPLRAWEELIGEYSHRSLSRETDKLSALSSLAQLTSGSQVGIPGFYVAGLWRENFIPGLAWSLHRNGSEHRRQCQYRAPTWSWASVDGPIRYDYRKYANMRGTLVAQNIDARVENVKCEPMSHYDMTGSIAWAQADLIGMLAPVNMIRLTKAVAADHLDDRYLVQGLSGDRFRVDIDFGADLCWRQLARSADICDIEDIRVPKNFRVEEITTQNKIDSLQSKIKDQWHSGDTQININGGIKTLNFTALSHLTSMSVSNSPELKFLGFPQLVFLEISNVTSLNTLSIPELNEDSFTFISYDISSGTTPTLDLNITNAPALTTINLQKSKFLGNLNLFSLHDQVSAFKAMTIFSIDTDSCVDFSRAESVHDIHFYKPSEFQSRYRYNVPLYNLTSVGRLTMDNSPTAYSSFGTTLSTLAVQVNDSVILANANDGAFITHYEFDRIETIHSDLNVTSFSNLQVTFDGLTQVGATLSLFNNTNCTFTFDQVSSVVDLLMVDNVDTMLPLFPKLQNVDNIYMRGYINTSTGPNIFSALVLARGNVTIEAWNEDFNCSKLVSQWNDGLIHQLSCNGTSNGISNALSPSLSNTPSNTTGSSTLPPGALAGIGVGAGLFGIGLIVAVAWLLFHYKRRLNKLELAQRQEQTTRANENPTETIAPVVSGPHKTSGIGIVREKPDDSLIELPVPAVELPINDH
ncbi:hypothetical protein F5Y07DRAFT_411429 [Xylaria sp. FL0933]|nr:hypothetical protein F5Y07DRAFT_411429 [Xylaria sp. FL0933]